MPLMLEFYELREHPFGVTPDPRFLFPSVQHRAALAALIFGIENKVGFAALIAEPGTGKTTLLFDLLLRYRDRASTAFVCNTQCSGQELLRHIIVELKIPVAESELDPVRLHQHFTSFVADHLRTKPVVIIIDEAQNLESSALEALRLLSNFEAADRKLLHIILAGQPQLGDTLRSQTHTQLLQRITTISRLDRLSPEQIEQCISYRLRVAGYAGPPLFSEKALGKIKAASGGLPREINRICINALQRGFALRQRQIGVEVIERVLSDLNLSCEGPSERPEEIQRTASKLAAVAAKGFESVVEPKSYETSVKPKEILVEQNASKDLANLDLGTQRMVAPVMPPSVMPPPGIEKPMTEPHTRERQKTRFGLTAAIAIPVCSVLALAVVLLGATALQYRQQSIDAGNSPQPQPQQSVDASNSPSPQKQQSEPQKTDAIVSPALVESASAVPSIASGKGAVTSPKRHPRLVNEWLEVVRRDTSQNSRKLSVTRKTAMGSERQVQVLETSQTESPSPAETDATTGGFHSDQRSGPVASSAPIKSAASTFESIPDHVPSGARDTRQVVDPAAMARPNAALSHETGSALRSVRPGTEPLQSPQPRPAQSNSTGASTSARLTAPGFTNTAVRVPDKSDSTQVASIGAMTSTTHPSSSNVSGRVADRSAALITFVRPDYPPVATTSHLKGDVSLKVKIGGDGAVREVNVLSGNPILVQAAKDAIQQWRYRPALLHGSPVAAEEKVTFTFREE